MIVDCYGTLIGFWTAMSPPKFPVWKGCDGWLRIGHTDDLRQMLDDLGHRSVAA